jgi:hypothetical protein
LDQPRLGLDGAKFDQARLGGRTPGSLFDCSELAQKFDNFLALGKIVKALGCLSAKVSPIFRVNLPFQAKSKAFLEAALF